MNSLRMKQRRRPHLTRNRNAEQANLVVRSIGDTCFYVPSIDEEVERGALTSQVSIDESTTTALSDSYVSTPSVLHLPLACLPLACLPLAHLVVINFSLL